MSDKVEIGSKVKTPYGSGIVISLGEKVWVSLHEGLPVKEGQVIKSVPVPLDCIELLKEDVKKLTIFNRPRDTEG